MKDACQTVTIARGHGDPLVVTATVVSLEHKQETDFGGTRTGLSAHLHVGEPPHSYFLSQLAGETDWIIDAHFGPDGMPYHCHGFGARYLQVRAIAPELANLIDQRVDELGPFAPCQSGPTIGLGRHR